MNAPHNQSFQNKVLSHGIWASIGRILNLFVGLAVAVCLSRLLSREDFGKYATAYSYSSLAAVLASFGLDRVAQIRIGNYVATTGSPQRSTTQLIYICFAATANATAFAAMATYFLASGIGLKIQFSWPLVATIAAVGIGRGAVIVGAAIARACNRPALANLLGGSLHAGPTANILFVSAILSTHLFFGGITWVHALLCLAGTTLFVGGILYHINITVETDPIFDIQDESFRSNLNLCFPIVGVTLAQILVSEFDVALLSNFSESDDVALYAACRRLVIVLGIPLGLLNLAIVSSVSELWSAGELQRLTKLVQIASAAACLPILLAILVLFVVPGQVLGALFGQEYAIGETILRALLPGQLAFALSGACGLVLIQSGHSKLALTSNIVGAFLLCTLGYAAGKFGGVVPYAVAVSIIVATKNAISWYFAMKYVGVKTHPQFGSLLSIIRRRGLLRGHLRK